MIICTSSFQTYINLKKWTVSSYNKLPNKGGILTSRVQLKEEGPKLHVIPVDVKAIIISLKQEMETP